MSEREIMPGVVVNEDGELHLYLPDMLADAGYDDTPENRDRLEQAAIEMCRREGIDLQYADRPSGRDTSGMDRFYGGEEPPFAVNDDFAASGNIMDY